MPYKNVIALRGPQIPSPFRGNISTGPKAIGGGFPPLSGGTYPPTSRIRILPIFKSFVIIFVDESGAKSLCRCVALGAVAFQPRPGVSYLELGKYLVEGIKRMLRVGGELKWRDVVRRGRPEAVLALIQAAAEVRCTAFHYTGEAELAARLEELVRGST